MEVITDINVINKLIYKETNMSTAEKESNALDAGEKLRNEIKKRLQKKDYLVRIFQTGDYLMGGGEHERMVCPRRSYKICSLEELPEVIRFMKEPFWEHPDLRQGIPQKEIKNIPFDEKRWGIYYDIDIIPLSEEKVEEFQYAIESGLLDQWRKYGKKCGQLVNEDTQTSA